MIDLLRLAQSVVDTLRIYDMTVVTAESLTGGLIAATLVSVPGASHAVRGGFVTYQTEMKTTLLDVPSEVIKKYNVVSEEVAIAMAENARLKSGADIAVSATGLAGPGGGTDEIPVGTVYIGVSSKKHLYAIPLLFDEEDRDEIRRGAVIHALLNIKTEVLR